jgi:hypothetical protein
LEEAEESTSMDEIREKCNRLWVAMKVVEKDEAGQFTRGMVTAVDYSRFWLRKKIPREEEVCICYSGPIPQPGYLVVF